MSAQTKAPILEVFVSATSADLAPCRDIARRVLTSYRYFPVEQSDFAPDYRTVREMLYENIRGCEAMIHIVGECYGMEPLTRAASERRRSYTQLEHEIARELGLPIIRFICAPDFPYATHSPETPEKQALQQAYRDELQTGSREGNYLFTWVKTKEDLEIKLMHAVHVWKIAPRPADAPVVAPVIAQPVSPVPPPPPPPSVPVVAKPWTLALPGNVPLELLPVAPGTFLMGSPKNEPVHFDNETQHSVRITRPYWLGKFPVTQAQWQAVMGSNPSHFKGAQRPVEQVSWEEAQEIFCEKLTNQERAAGRLLLGYRYTLPTEAQWEYACRAGTTTPFNTGRNLTTDQANYNGNYPYNGNPKGKYRETTTDVGSFPANAWGFCDMHGNVWEWCRDWYKTSPAGGDDPLGAASGSIRVDRGGGWIDGAQGCRSAARRCGEPGSRDGDLGFRLALSSVGV
jgi:formylglycine-generating enzyme required for sulfatase activity